MTDGLPPGALLYLPVLQQVVTEHWPPAPLAILAGQVEQETCPSLQSKKCWSPRAELITKQEYGFGLGQLTVTARFDNFQAAKKLHPSLATWEWENRYDPKHQLKTLVLMNRREYVAFAAIPSEGDRIAMMLSAYNGGRGGVLNDRRLCRTVAGCDPDRWFGHVEKTSYKAKTKVSGYGQSFFDINRGYVRNITGFRQARYADFLDKVRAK